MLYIPEQEYWFYAGYQIGITNMPDIKDKVPIQYLKDYLEGIELGKEIVEEVQERCTSVN